MCNELVKDLRICAEGEHCDKCGKWEVKQNGGRNACEYAICTEAADAIEELTAIREEQKAQIILMTAEIEEQQPRWIPVTERLPENDCPVLVTYLGFHDRSPRANMLAYIDRDLGWCWWNDDIPDWTPCAVEITHWMPLPQPPKEE